MGETGPWPLTSGATSAKSLVPRAVSSSKKQECGKLSPMGFSKGIKKIMYIFILKLVKRMTGRYELKGRRNERGKSSQLGTKSDTKFNWKKV